MSVLRCICSSGVLVVVVVWSSAQSASAVQQVPKTLIVGGTSNVDIDISMTIDTGVIGNASDSDSDSSGLNGTVDVLVDVEFDINTGQAKISALEITGGNVAATSNMIIDLDFVPIVSTDDLHIAFNSIGGEPGTPIVNIPSVVNPNATPGTNGSFDADDHNWELNQGSIVVSGASSSTRNLASEPLVIDGSTTTAGTMLLPQGSIDLPSNTTTYDLEIFVPFLISGPVPGTEGNPQVVSSSMVVTAVINAGNSSFSINFVPTNGVAGDVTQNGSVGTEDIDAFKSGLGSTGLLLGLVGYQSGDIDFDGDADVDDANLMLGFLAANGINITLGELYPDGDFDRDLSITTADYDIMKANWLSTGNDPNSNGDVTGDGEVGLADFAKFKNELFPGGASAFAAAVPEPCSSLLMLVGSLLTWCAVRRR